MRFLDVAMMVVQIKLLLNNIILEPKASRIQEAMRKGQAAPNDIIDAESNVLRIAPVSAETRRILAPEYSGKMKSFAIYLTTMRRPAEITTKEARQLKQEALRFRVEGDQLS